ncbi:sensor histidine kinase, partial [Chromobacterium vaccinii]
PHFLFNSLNAAIALIRSRPQRAETVLENLAELFRAQMAAPERLSTLAREIELAKMYLAIESERLGPRLTVSWRIDAPP